MSYSNVSEATREAAHLEYIRLVNLRSKAKGDEKRALTKAVNAASAKLLAMR